MDSFIVESLVETDSNDSKYNKKIIISGFSISGFSPTKLEIKIKSGVNFVAGLDSIQDNDNGATRWLYVTCGKPKRIFLLVKKNNIDIGYGGELWASTIVMKNNTWQIELDSYCVDESFDFGYANHKRDLSYEDGNNNPVYIRHVGNNPPYVSHQTFIVTADVIMLP